MTRFFVLRWPPARSDLARIARAHGEVLERQCGLAKVLDWRGVIVLVAQGATDERIIELPSGVGFVFGVLFAGSGARKLSFEYDEALRLAETSGASMFESYWGGYVALLIDREHDRVHILRDPMGPRSCYWAELDGLRCVFSDVADLASIKDCGRRDARVAAFLAMPHLITAETALEGVEEVLPGARMTLGRDSWAIEMAWTPPAPDSKLGFDEAAHALGEVLQQCVAAWSRLRPKLLHRLSGGLDSSAVLSLLRQARGGEDILSINESSTAAPEGDERAIARAVCGHFGVALHELVIAPQDVRFERALDAPLMAAPSMTVLSFAERSYDLFAVQASDALMTSGQGGDQMFYRSRSTLIAAEAARKNPAPWAWGPAAYDVARLSGKSIWRVSRDAVLHGVARWPVDPATYFQPGADMARAARPAAHQLQMCHPWLKGRGLGPAQTGRILGLAQAQHYHWPNILSSQLMTINPLLSQPVSELVFRLPAHLITQSGRDRALYRAAVAPFVPPQVLFRTTKGQTTRHFAEVAALNGAVLREALMEGELCASGLLDRAALEAVMDKSDITTLGQMDNVLIAFAAEAWMRAWTRARAARREVVAA